MKAKIWCTDCNFVIRDEGEKHFNIYKSEDHKGLNSIFEDVKLFHKTFNHSVSDKPKELSRDRANKRLHWMNSELTEFDGAKDVVDQADAMIDLIYFAVGTLVEIGVKPQNLWDIVQNANMAKLWPDGKPHYYEDGKVKKPEGWKDPYPLLKAEIKRQQGENVEVK